jgi:hypothetical protein
LSKTYKSAIKKFIKATGAYGVYLYDSGRIIVLEQSNPNALLALRQTITSLDEETEIKHDIEGLKFGIIVNELVRDENGIKTLIMVAEASKLRKVKIHWKRLSPVLKRKIPLETIVEEDSLQTKIVRVSSQIMANFEEIILYYNK